VDGTNIESGTAGVASPTVNDHHPNLVKNTVSKQYRAKYPNAKHVAVVILEAKKVSKDEYYAASPSFIPITV
jgi:hypothetical protein